MLTLLLLVCGLASSAQDAVPGQVHGAERASRSRHSAEHSAAGPARRQPAALAAPGRAQDPARSSAPSGDESDPGDGLLLSRDASLASQACRAAPAPKESCSPPRPPRSRVPGASAKP